MTEVRRGEPVGRPSGGAVLRGVILVVVAVLVGLVVLDSTDAQVLGADPEREVVTGGRAAVEPDADDDDPADGDPADGDEVAGAAGGPDGAADDDEDEAGATEDEATEDEATADEAAEGDEGTTTSTTAAGPRAPEEVTVLVANGSGLQGAAATVTSTLDEAGYETAAPSNLPAGTRANASVVYYAEGFQEEAEAVAASFTPAPQVAPMPTPAPLEDLRGASVVLVLGPDLATP